MGVEVWDVTGRGVDLSVMSSCYKLTDQRFGGYFTHSAWAEEEELELIQRRSQPLPCPSRVTLGKVFNLCRPQRSR